ncbi:hypothetical protein BD289DRAFT_450548 [Coniella lustricola]|uniref:Beta/gamma crystallin 'Greek key' domain-containing protein n=1 Tax=Coniella lustricola TaxID=2025994 RepID=A0A2T3AI45_9PEZI|nr:hypothetical protein BD289DRAFT_450548 [Coniella lustricola]
MKMQFTILATILSLAATGLGYGNVTVTLCNDFHGGKPCELHNAVPGTCNNVDANLYHYITSVQIAQEHDFCHFYSGANCTGSDIVVYYPGNADLEVNYSFDNQILSYLCEIDSFH